MKNSEYKLMSEIEDDHWWWLGRNKIIEAVIKNQIDFSDRVINSGCWLRLWDKYPNA
ncbi:MAG: hypothetical protein QMD86_00195 [Patescibacteria group bacterium]|nr:hypothetical protein [Patescibacteria group bacterium]